MIYCQERLKCYWNGLVQNEQKVGWVSGRYPLDCYTPWKSFCPHIQIFTLELFLLENFPKRNKTFSPLKVHFLLKDITFLHQITFLSILYKYAFVLRKFYSQLLWKSCKKSTFGPPPECTDELVVRVRLCLELWTVNIFTRGKNSNNLFFTDTFLIISLHF